MIYQPVTLKLSHFELQAFDWWLRHVLLYNGNNYYVALQMLTLGTMWQKKVHPNLVIIQKVYKMKLDRCQTLALTMTFQTYNYFDAPAIYQADLYRIFSSLPQNLHINERDRFIPPQLLPDGQEEE